MGAGKRKGTVHPSNALSSSAPRAFSTSTSTSCKNPESVLKLLPVTILALALSLPTQDREVLAYLIARSILNPTSSTHHNHHPNAAAGKCKRRANSSNGAPSVPLFGCGCFECYTSFWYRWDSSPNRELIHQVIEAFEEHMVVNESTRKKQANPSKGKRGLHLEKEVGGVRVVPEVVEEVNEEEVGVEVGVGVLEEQPQVAVVVGGGTAGVGRSNHKCLARKVLPDVVGLFNSRFWSLWSPGI